MSNTQSQVSLRLPIEWVALIDQIASACGRDRSWVMLRALGCYLNGEGAAILDEANGIAELDKGVGVDFDVTIAKAEAIIAGKG